MLRVVGIGPGDVRYITQEARVVLENSDIIYGYERQIEAMKVLPLKGEAVIYQRLDELKGLLFREGISLDTMNISVLASGEPSLYGIAKYIGELFPQEERGKVEIVSGISSVQYLFAKVKIPMNDVYITSCHGKELDIDKVKMMDKIAFLTDKEKGPAYLADVFLLMGEDPTIIVGENLSYENEKITICKSSELDKSRSYELCVVIIIKD